MSQQGQQKNVSMEIGTHLEKNVHDHERKFTPEGGVTES